MSDSAYKREDNGSKHSREETMDFKTFDKPSKKPKKKTIDNKSKNTKCEEIDRKRQNKKNRFDRYADHSPKKSEDQGSSDALYANS